ncbi:epimerase [Gordonia terrae]
MSGTESPTVVLAGGSGALGTHLATDLAARGHHPVILTRRIDPSSPFEQVIWDGKTQGDWVEVLAADRPTAVVNLAGKLVDCRPTEANIAALRSSRVDATRALVVASRSRSTPISYWLQSGTTAIWSDAGDQWCTESTPVPLGLPQMTGVAQPWEDAVDGANTDHLTVLRTSIVLDADAPAMRRLVGLTRFGLGGRVGDGRQWFSWIHIDDWLAIARAALRVDDAVSLPDGVVVAASPYPVRNTELMAMLRAEIGRPPAPPTPAWLLKLGAVVLRTDPALGLTGRRARSDVLADVGFEFRFPRLEDALSDLL